MKTKALYALLLACFLTIGLQSVAWTEPALETISPDRITLFKPGLNQPLDSMTTMSWFCNQNFNWDAAKAMAEMKFEKSKNIPGFGQGCYGGPLGQRHTTTGPVYAISDTQGEVKIEQLAKSQSSGRGTYAVQSVATGEQYAGPNPMLQNTGETFSTYKRPHRMVPWQDRFHMRNKPDIASGGRATEQTVGDNHMTTQMAAASQTTTPDNDVHGEGANNNAKQGARAGSAGEDSKSNTHAAFDAFLQYMTNVANEDAGAPCDSDQVSKTYANVAWMVMRMYKQCYIPMAVLFLLPGALITNTKTLVTFGLLQGNGDDVASPFAGIMRSIIAIFLIFTCQLVVSYCIDIGNSMEYSTIPYVNLPLIYAWCEEQMQTFSPDQQGDMPKNLPIVPEAPYRGKFAGMPTSGAVLEQVSGLDLALMELSNECFHMMSVGLNVITGFQFVMIFYLFLMGPLAAAFFAWPSIGSQLFRKAFGTWLDGVVVVSLWKVWWNVVLICMTARLMTGHVDPYNPFEVYYLAAFMSIMLVVPFNPFDFRPGEIVSTVLMKAEGVAGKVASSPKSGGATGSGKGNGGK